MNKNMNYSAECKDNKLFFQTLEYYLGIGKEKNLVIAKSLLRKSSEMGNTKSMNLLADLYIKNIFPCDNYKEAFCLYSRGYELGDVRSLYRMGMCYEKGIGTTKDIGKAVSTYEEAYKLGNASACFNLARIYERGDGVLRSLSKSVSWYKKGAEKGDADCACNLAFCYYKGSGVERDVEKAKELFLEHSDYSSLVQRNLGVIFYKGTSTSSPDEENGVYWLTQAANNGDSTAMLHLGKIYIPKDRETAMSWYRKAANIDKKAGAYTYAFYLYKYNETDNWKLSFSWMKCAAENEHIPAQFMLGLFYKCGVGTDVDHTKAFYWFNVAAENDYEQAYCHIGRYYRDGRIVTKNYETALVWFELAISSKDVNVRSEGLFDYGIMFLEGLGVKKNRNKAIDFLAESQSLGCINATKKLQELNNPEKQIKTSGRSSIIEHGDIVQYVQMKIEDCYTESNWVANIYEKLIVYIECVKDCGLVTEYDDDKYVWTLGNIDYAQWMLMVSDDLHLYCLNEKKERSYYPKYFANLFLSKKKQKFKPIDLRHNLHKLNNPVGGEGEKNFDVINESIIMARRIIKNKGL